MAHEPAILWSIGSNASAGIRVLHVISVGVISSTRLICCTHSFGRCRAIFSGRTFGKDPFVLAQSSILNLH